MLNPEEVYQAVDLQRRSYNLLRWLSTAVSKGVIRFERAHDYLDEAEVARDWIEGHYLNLPPECRPAKDQLLPFARFFATYLTTSFELEEHPRKRIASTCGCYCPMCTYMITAPRLKLKKVQRRDKMRARKIKILALQQLAQEHNAHLDQEQAEKLIDSPATTVQTSLIAYGQQLVARTQGISHGPAVLALWREIAWDKTSPRKNFQLEAENILTAEQSLAKQLASNF